MPAAALSRSPTLATLAASLGVSPATVSRALAGSPLLAPATVRRVRAAARAAGYRRNPLVSDVMRRLRVGARAQLKGTLAYLVFGASRDEWERHLTYVGFLGGARTRAEEFGYRLERFWANAPGLTGARLTDILLARGIAGVLVGPTPGLPVAPELDWSRFAAVKIGVPFPDVPLPCAVSHHFRGMQRVIAELGARGYRRLGLVLQEHQNRKTAGMWMAPLTQHLRERSPRDRVEPLLLSRWSEAEFSRWYRQWRPDAIIGLRSELVGWLRRLGRRVPEDVGFVHLDRCTESGGHAGLDQRAREIGAAAIDLLSQRLLANEVGLPSLSQQLLIESVWSDGDTLRRAESD